MMRAEQKWRERAACKYVSQHLFFPEEETSFGNTELEVARDYCRACPVQPNCLKYAMDTNTNQEWGIWGGLTTAERKRLHRQRLAARAAQRR